MFIARSSLGRQSGRGRQIPSGDLPLKLTVPGDRAEWVRLPASQGPRALVAAGGARLSVARVAQVKVTGAAQGNLGVDKRAPVNQSIGSILTQRVRL